MQTQNSICLVFLGRSDDDDDSRDECVLINFPNASTMP